MTHIFNDREGLRIAVEMERRGVELYRRAQRICRTQMAKDMLARLEMDEVAHQREFARLLDSMGAAGEDYSLEKSAYLSALAADVVFSGGLVEMGCTGALESPAAILRYAIQGEKDSLLFYEGITEQATQPLTREVFEEIIRQERGHLAALVDMLKEEEG